MNRPGSKDRRGAFWDALWKTADRARLADMAAQLDCAPDPMILFLKERGAQTVCDAGCGCGAYARKLAQHGFAVCGFDISADAAALAQEITAGAGAVGPFRAGDILAPPFPDAAFDAVVSRSVIDHLPRADGIPAVRALLRLVRPGGYVLLTLDETDGEYESERHIPDPDGDYRYTGGKWDGMVFHPYREAELSVLTPDRPFQILDDTGGLTVAILNVEGDRHADP